MPNEFIARNGFISKDNSVVSGSISATLGITGSVLSASYSVTAAYSINTATASFVQSAISASYSLRSETASFAVTAAAWSLPSYNPTVGLAYIATQQCFGEVTQSFGSRPGINNILCSPFIVHKDCQLENVIVTLCSSGSGIATTCSIGIYSDAGNMLPKDRLQSLGTVSTNSSSLFQHLTLTPNPKLPLKAKTIYWLAIVGDDGLVLPVPTGSYASTYPNQLWNPLLGVELTASLPVSGLYPIIKNISSYGFVSGSAGNPAIGLPLQLPQTFSQYTINSYSQQFSYILPLIGVSYG